MTMTSPLQRLALAAALAWPFAWPLGAQALDLSQALQSAAAIDPVLASARAQVEVVRQRVPQARAVLGPQANFTASASLQGVDTSRAPFNDINTQQLGLSGSVPLQRPAALEALSQAELAAELAELQLAQARQDLILRVAQAYFDVLAAQDSLAAIGTQKRAITEQFESARRNFEVGTATITDQQEAQARLDLALAQEVAVTNELEVRRAALAQLIGRPANDLFTLRPGADIRPPEAGSEPEWTRRAREANLGVRQSEIASRIAEREIERQRLAGTGTLDAVASLAASRSSDASPVSGGRRASASVGLQYAVPLFDGGLVPARTREAIAARERAQFDLQNVRRIAEQGARQTFLGVSSGLQQVRALEAAERSSQLALESNLLGYQVGVRISIDVLNAVQQLTLTQRDLARARYDVLLNGLRLRNTAGNLTEEDVRAVSALLESAPPPKPAPPLGAAPAGSPPAGTAPNPGSRGGRAMTPGR